MKILVTGANGYLGTGVVKQILDDGHEVIATDYECKEIDKRAKSYSTDLFSVKNPYAFFEKPDVLLHMAWRNGFVHNSPSHIEDFSKHYSFIESVMNSDIERVAIIGSMHEIGFFEGSIKDDTPANPQSLYGISKNALRQSVCILEKKKNKKIQGIRVFYIVGNSSRGSSIFSKIVKAEQEGKKFFPFTKGLNQWDFIDYEEFCLQVASIVEQDKYCGIINACSGYPEKLADRVEKFINDNHYKIRLSYGSFQDRPYDSKAVWGDDTKIKKIMALKEENTGDIISKVKQKV